MPAMPATFRSKLSQSPSYPLTGSPHTHIKRNQPAPAARALEHSPSLLI